MRRNLVDTVVFGLICVLSATISMAQVMVHEFYLPLPEQQVRSSFVSLSNATKVGNTLETVFSIVVTGPDTIIHYDHWEDGYEVDINNPKQSTTEIWGDGDNSNGIAPGFKNDPMGLPMGTVIYLRNNVSLPRNPTVRLYDARDRVTATKALVVTRATWSTKIGPLLACAVEVQATIDYGTSFIAPVGEDVDANKMFDYVGLFVMADSDNTQITIDKDGPGGAGPITVTLNRGESYHVDGGIKKGATVTSTKPVQAHLVTGHKNANYEARWFTLYPVDDWYSSYVTPVGTASNGHETYMFVYNPHDTVLDINFKSRTGDGSFTVSPGQSFQWQVPRSSGAILESADGRSFSAVSTVGAKPNSNNVHDWGFAPVPADALTTELIVGWGPGSTDLSKNGSPVWVTAEAATTIYVDYNGDNKGPHTDSKGNKYDAVYDLAALESKTIFDPDRDQTAMRIYTLDGVRLAAAWGQDPATAGAANPYLDMGTAVLPHPIPVIDKFSELTDDRGLTGLSVGDILTYTVTVDNKGLLPLGNTLVLDNLPATLKYCEGTTTINGEELPDDADGDTIFPLDESGYTIPIILRGGTSVFTYQVEVLASGKIVNTVGNPEYELEVDNKVEIQTPSGSSPCYIDFVNAEGVPVEVYSADSDIYILLQDTDANQDSSIVETITIYVKNVDTGDIEPLVLTETSANSGVFINTTPLPSSTASGLGEEDGTLYARPGDKLSVFYQDPIYGCSDSDMAVISAPSKIKPLYLKPDNSEGESGLMDRIDPVAAEKTEHSQSIAFGAPAYVPPVPATITPVGAAASSTRNNQSGSSHSFQYNSGTTGDNRILMVGISYYHLRARTVSGVTYGGQVMDLVGTSYNGNNARTAIYQLVNPPTGNNSLAVTWDNNVAYAVVGAVTYAGVDPAVPLGTFNSASATSTTPSVTVASDSGEVVFGVVGGQPNAAYTLGGSGGTSLWSNLVGSNITGAGQSKPGTTSTAVSWSGSSAIWAAGGVSLKPAMIGGSGGGGAVVVDKASQGSANSSTLTISHTTGSGDNRLMLVGVSISAYTSGSQVNGITYGNQPLTRVRSNLLTESGNYNPRTEIWQLVNPNPGTANVTIQLSTSRIMAAGVTTFSGVDQTNPLASDNAANGSSTTASVTVSGGSMYYGVVCASKASPSPTLTDGTGQTRQWHLSLNNGNSYMTGAGAVKSSNGTLSWTSNASAPWSASAVAINGVPIGGEITFTQTPNFCRDFVMPAGGAISAVNYVQLASGTLSANPDISATVGYGENEIITLSSPTATLISGGTPSAESIYRIDWSSALSSQVTVPSGSALSLTVENNSGVAFSILYDSEDYPSKVSLPASTIITIDELAFYDAPYPDGLVVDNIIAGATVYARATVADPFGAYDITGLDLVSSELGLNKSLTDVDVVYSNACTKVYEYPVQIGADGKYNLAATAHEGSEGITDAAATTIDAVILDTGTPGLVEFTVTDNGSRTNVYEPDQVVYVRVTDADQNKNPDGIDTVVVVITTESGDKETVTLYETGPNTGVFTTNVIASSTNTGTEEDESLYLPPGTNLKVEYIDPDDPTDYSLDNATVPLQQGTPGISISKTRVVPQEGIALVGDRVSYTIRVSNIGGTALSSVTVEDEYPVANLSYVEALPTPTTTGSGTLSWSSVGPLAAGESKTILVVFDALAPSTELVENKATVNASGGLNKSSVATVEIIKPEVTVTKTILTPATGPVPVGDTITYQVVVANTGSTPITFLPLEDTFSAAYLKFVSATITPDGVGAGSLFWADLASSGSLIPSDSITIEVVMEVVGGGNPVLNSARVDYAQDSYDNDVPPSGSEVGIETKAVLISGNVYLDPNKNMTGTDGIADVTVTLYSDPNNDGNFTNVVAIAKTQADGSYEFPNLGLGKYVVVESDLPGMVSSGDSDGGNANRIAVDATTLKDYTGNNFWDYTLPVAEYGSVSGTVRLDDNADGEIDTDTEKGVIKGVTVQLVHDLNGDGTWDADEPVIQIQQTGANGSYNFGAVPAGNYIVIQTDLPGYVSTGDVDGGDENQIVLELAEGQKSTGNDFYDTKVGRIGHKVWNDLNGDGIQDPGEPGIPGVTVKLYDSTTDDLLDTVVTSADGSYVFADLMPGEYYVVVDKPEGFFTSPQGAGSDPTADSNGDANGKSGVITLAAGDIEADIDFGFYEQAKLYGYAFADLDDTQTRTQQDGVANGMEVQLWQDGKQIATTNADENGYYEFTGLDKGSYEVIFVCGEDALILAPEEGTDAARDVERSRAETNATGYGQLSYMVTPGHGMSPDNPGEPANAGFKGTGPLSSGIDLRAYATADGVYVEFIAYDVESDDWMTLYLLDSNGNVIWFGNVSVVAGAEQFVRFKVPGLKAGNAYDFAVRDEVGKVWWADDVKVGTLKTEMIAMSNQGVVLSFNSLPDRNYAIEWTAELDKPWQLVTAVTAISSKTTVVVQPLDISSPTGFFRIVLK